MKKCLEKLINEIFVILGKVTLAMMIFGAWVLITLCQHSYGNQYKGFANCGRRVSDTKTEIDTGSSFIYIVDGVWLDITGRLGGI
jgi:hypothetical protein